MVMPVIMVVSVPVVMGVVVSVVVSVSVSVVMSMVVPVVVVVVRMDVIVAMSGTPQPVEIHGSHALLLKRAVHRYRSALLLACFDGRSRLCTSFLARAAGLAK